MCHADGCAVARGRGREDATEHAIDDDTHPRLVRDRHRFSRGLPRRARAAILANLLIRAPDLGALYTEEGVLPRSLLDEQGLNLVPHLMFDGALG